MKRATSSQIGQSLILCSPCQVPNQLPLTLNTTKETIHLRITLQHPHLTLHTIKRDEVVTTLKATICQSIIKSRLEDFHGDIITKISITPPTVKGPNEVS